MNAPPSLLVNGVRNSNHWIAFRLIGTSFASVSQRFRTSRDALGARIMLKSGSRTFVNEVRSGSSYDSNSDMRVHFSVGAATKLDSVEVRWPRGLTERFGDLAVDKIHALKEGAGAPVTSSETAPAVEP